MSDLVPYEITDFWWDSIEDQVGRQDVTTLGTTLLPRLIDDPLTAKQRFTKFVPFKPVRLRLDLTDRPLTFVNATQGHPEHPTTKTPVPASKATARAISRTIAHYDTHWSTRKYGRS